MERRTYKHPYDFDPSEYKGEQISGNSQTVPDQSLSVKDILFRFSKGMPLDDYTYPLAYGRDEEQDEDNFDVHPANVQGLDLADAIEMREACDNVINRYKEQLQTTTINDDDANATKNGGNNGEVTPHGEV